MEQQSALASLSPLITEALKLLVVSIPLMVGAYHSYKQKRKIARIKTSAKLTNHLLHQKIKNYLRYIDTSFTLQNRVKEKVWKDFLTNYFKIFAKNLEELSNSTDECIQHCNKKYDSSCHIFYSRNMETLNKSIGEYNNYYKNNNYSTQEQEILSILINNFNEIHQEAIELLENDIREYSENDIFYPTCISKQIAIFDSYSRMFALTMSSAAKVLNLINGNLDGKIFKGEII